MKRIAIYARVSTKDQDLAMQIAALRQHCKAKGWEVAGVYTDVRTGTNSNRPSFQRMFTDVRAGRIDTVLCWKLDRFSRSLQDLLTSLQELQDRGCGFEAVQDNIDLNSPMGRFIMQILGAVAEFEAMLISQRTKDALAFLKAQGVKLGPPKRRDDAAIRLLRAEGLSLRAIAKRLGCSVGCVQDGLRPSCGLRA